MHTLTQPISTHAPHAHTERGAHIIELKRRYDEGTLLEEVTSESVTDLLLDALFGETAAEPTTIH
jgi:hypothetical protein